MGARGPKPVDFRLLCIWEFEFYKALHQLREGTPFPTKYEVSVGLTPIEVRKFITELKRMNPEHYWLTTRRVAVELGKPQNLNKPPLSIDLWWAESERDREIYSLEKGLRPRSIVALVKRRKIWLALLSAETHASLRKACGRWARLPDVRRDGLTCFPQHVVENSAQFLFMKCNRRFARSNYGDDSRLTYLAQGMAGVLCGRRAMTGIERLRNMKHEPGGPLWMTREGNCCLPNSEQYCGCWRCGIKRSSNVTQIMQMGYENGLKLFMELAATTKVPSEWITSRKRIYQS